MDNSMDEIFSDPRFSHIAFDPRYRNAPTKDIKVQLDSRFKTALTNENFNSKSLMDPRGRPKSYGTKEKMDKFYSLQSSLDESGDDEGSDDEGEEESDEESEEESESEKVEQDDQNISKDSSLTKEKNSQKKEVDKDPKFLRRLLDPERDMARGYDYFSDDSSDDDSSTTDEDEVTEEFEWGEMDGDAQWDQQGNEFEETHRFAVCNMDWDNIKAVDLMMLFSSFAPAGGAVVKVSILPSDFGKKRLEEEEVSGPQELVRLVASKKKKCDELIKDLENIEKGKVDETAEATLLQLEALRKYQRNRMLYFYGVVVCDSVDTASAIYKECDRMLYELSGIILDLRYIPDDMEFDQVPRDVCEKALDSYNQQTYHSTGFNASRPKLSWDETDRRRTNAIANVMTSVMQKKDFDENAVKGFIAMSDDDDDESDDIHVNDDTDEDEGSDEENLAVKKEERISKFRALISEIEEKEMRKKRDKLVFDSDEESDGDKDEDGDEGDESESDDNKDKLTPFEKYLSKRREKKKVKSRNKKVGDDKSDDNNDKSDENDVDDENEADKRVKEVPHVYNNEKDSKKKNNWRIKRKEKLQSQENEQPEEIKSSLSLLVMDEEESNKKHFDMRKINEEKKNNEKNKKGKRKKEDVNLKDIDDFTVDSTDPRFSAMFSHGQFNLDPSHSRFNPHSSYNLMASRSPKKQKTDNAVLKDKTSHRQGDVIDLVNRIKRKTKKFNKT